VGAMGLPWRRAQYQAEHTEFRATDVPPNVVNARHALALHELRKDFEPMMWTCINGHSGLMQVWFPGSHGDVGGGYKASESGLSDNALAWMVDEATRAGLTLKPTAGLARVGPFSASQLHTGIQGLFFFATPTPRPQLAALADSDKPEGRRHALHFHATACEHLVTASTSPYRSWRGKLVNAVNRVDDAGVPLLVLSRLLGNDIVQGGLDA